MPQTRPMMMIQPRSTLSRPAAATGPGCGGRNAWVIDSPASIGIAYSTSDRPPRFAATYTSGASTKMPMSKNTGMPRIRPVRPMASGAPLGPNSFSSRVVSTSAPPDRSMIAPSTVPSPMIGAMCPRMPPNPFSSSESAALMRGADQFGDRHAGDERDGHPTTISAMNGSSLTG